MSHFRQVFGVTLLVMAYNDSLMFHQVTASTLSRVYCEIIGDLDRFGSLTDH